MNSKYTTIMKEGTILNIDFGNTKADSVIFFDSTCVITGHNNEMKMIVAGPEFTPDHLPDTLNKDFFNIASVNFSDGNPFKANTIKYNWPQWLSEMKKMFYLRLENVIINDFNSLIKSDLKQLILIGVEFKNKDIALESLYKLPNLQYLVIDKSFNTKDISLLKSKLPKLIILTEEAFNKGISDGLILMPH
ncbi:hypothetical protein [Pedobacter nototheniae]|uniref:hypothetical protein n=1 Tax=Pedobacter nototheniae TaxID=2488994 RepID=UPI001038E95F|nr:hypothetical protein [Pedobacter nototheniae]